MKLMVAFIVTALAVTAFAAIGADNSSAEDNTVEIPAAVSGLVYDGTVKTGVPEGTGYTITGNTAANAGTYKATLTLSEGYVWSDNTTESKEITWNIGYKVVYITIKEAAVLLMSNDTSAAALDNDEVDSIKQIINDNYTNLTINNKDNLIINVNNDDNKIIKDTVNINYTIINDINTVNNTITYDSNNVNYNIINNDNTKYTIIKNTDTDYLIINNNNVIDKSNLTDSSVIVFVENSSYIASSDVNSIVYLANNGKTITTVDGLAAACFKVSFDKNNENAEGTMSDVTVMDKYTLPDCGFTVDGAKFMGWSLTADGEIIKTPDISITEDTTLYAVWGVDIPVAKTGLKYNCSEQTGVEEGEGYTLTGNTATDADDYTATATLKDGYIWSDGTKGAKEITWSIAKSKIRLNIANGHCVTYGEKISDVLRVVFDDGKRTEYEGEYAVTYSNAETGEYSSEEPTHAGNYYLKVTVTDSSIENPVLTGFMYTVSMIKLSNCDDGAFDVSPSGEITYDGNEHPVSSVILSKDSVYETINKSVTISYSENGSDYTDDAPVDVGTYSIKITAKSGSNYEDEKILENVFTIVPKTVAVAISDVVNAMKNNNTFDDPSVNSSLNSANFRIVVKNTDYVVTCDSSSNITISDETASISTVEEIVSLCSTVTFNKNNENAEGSMSDTIALNGYDLPKCGFTAPKGMHFAGWSLTADGKTITTESIPITGNTALYAVWEATEGTISSESNSYRFAADNTTTDSIEVILKEGKSEYTLTFAKGENLGGKTVSVTLNTAKTAENVTAYDIETDGISDFNVKLPCQKGFSKATVLCDGSSEGVSNVSYNSEEGYVTFTSNHNSLFTVTVSDAPTSDSETSKCSLIAAVAVLILSVAYFAVIRKM